MSASGESFILNYMTKCTCLTLLRGRVGFIMICIKYTISLNLSAWLLQSTFNMFIQRNADMALSAPGKSSRRHTAVIYRHGLIGALISTEMLGYQNAPFLSYSVLETSLAPTPTTITRSHYQLWQCCNSAHTPFLRL